MEKDQKNTLHLYIVFIISLICNVIPSTAIQFFGALLFIVALIAAYFYRAKHNKNTLVYTHMHFLIKTVWISSLFLAIGILAAVILADHSLIHQTTDQVMNGMFLDEARLHSILADYTKTNLMIFILTLSPSLLYFLYRLVKGIMAVQDNKLMPNPKDWF